jgi:hypothetical protein
MLPCERQERSTVTNWPWTRPCARSGYTPILLHQVFPGKKRRATKGTLIALPVLRLANYPMLKSRAQCSFQSPLSLSLPPSPHTPSPPPLFSVCVDVCMCYASICVSKGLHSLLPAALPFLLLGVVWQIGPWACSFRIRGDDTHPQALKSLRILTRGGTHATNRSVFSNFSSVNCKDPRLFASPTHLCSSVGVRSRY